MFQKGSPKSASRKSQRQALIIPHKNITIKTFFNQKLSNPQHKFNYIHCSNASFRHPSNIVHNRYKAAHLLAKTKYNYQSFVQADYPKDRVSSVFRNTSNSMRFVGKMRRRSLITAATAKSELNRESSQSHSLSANMNKNMLLDHSGIETIRKQLQLKFNRTRIILKEEERMQKYEKIQKIYDNRHKPREKQKISRPESRQSRGFYSPWHRVKAQGFDTINETQNKFINIID